MALCARIITGIGHAINLDKTVITINCLLCQAIRCMGPHEPTMQLCPHAHRYFALSGGPDCSLRLISFVGDQESRPSGSVVLGPGSSVQSNVVLVDGNRCPRLARMHGHDIKLCHTRVSLMFVSVFGCRGSLLLARIHLHPFPLTDTHTIYVDAYP